MRDQCCARGEILSLDELLNPMAEREDLDAQYLRFSDGKEGVTKILEYMKASGADGDEGKEEEPAEVEFDFDKRYWRQRNYSKGWFGFDRISMRLCPWGTSCAIFAVN
ncbi:hypothetical protein B0H14DRAFT_2589822 [Mycena olivaceomarginata]|nr:hypothetical protein B0H14DRAFT_2589822 [Mycena olivaceomarginata]